MSEGLQNKIKLYLEKGTVQDICHARQSYALLMTIGKNGPKLRPSPYVQFSQSLQGILSDNLVVHVSKLFEQPSRRHEVMSVPALLELISANQDKLEIVEKSLVCQQLANLGVQDVDQWSVSSADLSRIILDYFTREALSIKDSTALQSVRILRDKRVAHREAIDISDSQKATYREIYSLVEFAQNVTVVVGTAYTSTVHGSVNGAFYLGQDIEASARSLEKVFRLIIAREE